MTVWKNTNRWLIFSVIARLLSRNCSVTSSLKVYSSSFLKELLLISSILRKSSWEKLNTMVDSSFEIEVVVLVVVEWMSLVFFMSFLFCCRSLGKRQYCRHRMRIGCDVWLHVKVKFWSLLVIGVSTFWSATTWDTRTELILWRLDRSVFSIWEPGKMVSFMIWSIFYIVWSFLIFYDD